MHHTELCPKCYNPIPNQGVVRMSAILKKYKNIKKPSQLAAWCDTHRHSTHSPQIQIRLVMNLYLEPVHRSGNVIWARNVCPTFDSVDCPALPVHNQSLFVFFAHFHVCIQSAVPIDNIHITKPGSPFRLLHLEAPKVVIQGKHSKAFTAGFVMSDPPVRALVKWGKGHGCYVGTLTVQKVKDTASDIQHWGESR